MVSPTELLMSITFPNLTTDFGNFWRNCSTVKWGPGFSLVVSLVSLSGSSVCVVESVLSCNLVGTSLEGLVSPPSVWPTPVKISDLLSSKWTSRLSVTWKYSLFASFVLFIYHVLIYIPFYIFLGNQAPFQSWKKYQQQKLRTY